MSIRGKRDGPGLGGRKSGSIKASSITLLAGRECEDDAFPSVSFSPSPWKRKWTCSFPWCAVEVDGSSLLRRLRRRLLPSPCE